MTTIDTLVPEQLWQAIEPLLPPPPPRYGGRPRVDDRAALAGIVYQLHTGIPWRLLPPASSAAAARSPAGRACVTGNAPGCGSNSTTCCSNSSAAIASSTGPGPAWIPSACAPNGGRANRPEPDRPRQARLQVPPAGRPPWRPVGGLPVSRQHPRLDAARGHGRGRASRQGPAGPSRSTPQAPRQAPLRQGLRLPPLPAGAAPPWDHPKDRAAWHRVLGSAGPPSLGDRALAGLAGRLPAPAGPLRAPRRHPARIPPPRLRADLPQITEPAEGMKHALILQPQFVSFGLSSLVVEASGAGLVTAPPD
jgi:Putative transposase of IS4/5 family (DUF4096)